EVVEIVFNSRRLAALAVVIDDRRQQVRSAAVVQQEDPLTKAPQGCGPELVAPGPTLAHVVGQKRAHVMDLNIGVRTYDCAAERAGDLRFLGGARCWVVAGRATDRTEQCASIRNGGG